MALTSDTLDWRNKATLDRLGFDTYGDLAAFTDMASPTESKAWVVREEADGRLIRVDITNVDGSVRLSFARPSVLDETSPKPTGRLRVLSPFDAALCDGNRAGRLFGFHYRIKVFVPAPKRKYGFYVFPLLEGDQLVGRSDMKVHRSEGTARQAGKEPEFTRPVGRGGKGGVCGQMDARRRR